MGHSIYILDDDKKYIDDINLLLGYPVYSPNQLQKTQK